MKLTLHTKESHLEKFNFQACCHLDNNEFCNRIVKKLRRLRYLKIDFSHKKTINNPAFDFILCDQSNLPALLINDHALASKVRLYLLIEETDTLAAKYLCNKKINDILVIPSTTNGCLLYTSPSPRD